MQTGVWPHQNGIIINQFGNNEQLVDGSKSDRMPMLGRVLRNNGYRCAHLGKWHIPLYLDAVDIHGYDEAKELMDSDVPSVSAAFAHQAGEKPWFIVSSFTNPHDICEWASGRPLPQGKIPEPPAPEECPELPANFEIPANEPSVLRDFQQRRAPKYGAPYFEPPQWRQYLWAYWRLVEKVDAEIGRLLDAMKDHLENTVIIFTADHGDGAASHRWCQKQALYEEPTRVPFIVVSPDCNARGDVDSEHFVNSGIDLMPTICDYAGIDCPRHLTGRSVRPLVEGIQPDTWPDQVVTVTEFHEGGKSYEMRGRMVRTEKYKYNAFSHGEPREQLFDLENDPGEMHNLALDASYHSVIEEHRERLRKWCEETKDTVFDVPVG